MKPASPITIFILLFIALLNPVFAQPGGSPAQVVADTARRQAPAAVQPMEAVMFRGDTLFEIRTGMGSYSIQERIEIIDRNLEKLSKLELIRVDSFRVVEHEDFSVVFYRNQPVIHISDGDAQMAGMSRQELAEEHVASLKTAFTELLESRTWLYWLKRIGYTLLTLIGLIIIFKLINRIFRWINKKLAHYERGIMHKRTSILRYFLPQNNSNVFLFLSRVVRVLLIIVILFFYLPLLFSFFPWTEHLVTQFYRFIAEPVKSIGRGLLNFLPNVFYIIVIILIARYLLQILNLLTKDIDEEKLKIKGFHRDWAQPTANIIKILLYAFTLVFIFPYLPGSSSPAFRGVSIFLGVLFSLGSTSAIANIVAGIVITYMRPFMVGDRVRIGESVGDVMEKNLLVTRIRTIKNEDITIPNATIINAHLWNYSKSASSIGIIIHTTVTIGYDVPSKQVVDLLLKAAANTKDLSRESKPFVLQKSLGDFYVEYELNVYTKQPQKMAVLTSDLNNSILEEFNKAGVEIMSPHYSALRDGNASTIPAAEPPKTPVPPKNVVDQVIDKVSGKQ